MSNEQPFHMSYVGAVETGAVETGFDRQSGRKDDGGKARYDLIPPEALEELAKLYAVGARKYADRNWEKGMPWGRMFAALMRHAWAFWRGEEYDLVDAQHHMIAVAWNAFALYTYSRRDLGVDDRSVPQLKSAEDF